MAGNDLLAAKLGMSREEMADLMQLPANLVRITIALHLLQREAMSCQGNIVGRPERFTLGQLRAVAVFAQKVALHERQACASIARNYPESPCDPKVIAELIEQRSRECGG